MIKLLSVILLVTSCFGAAHDSLKDLNIHHTTGLQETISEDGQKITFCNVDGEFYTPEKLIQKTEAFINLLKTDPFKQFQSVEYVGDAHFVSTLPFFMLMKSGFTFRHAIGAKFYFSTSSVSKLSQKSQDNFMGAFSLLQEPLKKQKHALGLIRHFNETEPLIEGESVKNAVTLLIQVVEANDDMPTCHAILRYLTALNLDTNNEALQLLIEREIPYVTDEATKLLLEHHALRWKNDSCLLS